MLLCRRVHYCLLPSPPFQVEKGNWDMVRWLGWTWVESHDWAAPGTSHASCQAHRPVEISASVTVGNASFLQMLPAASALLTPCRCRGSPVPPQPFCRFTFSNSIQSTENITFLLQTALLSPVLRGSPSTSVLLGGKHPITGG